MTHSTLLCARHGQATTGPDHVWTPEDPLTELGRRQAEELAAHIAARKAPPTRIVASPFVRAIQTAEPVAALLGIAIEPDPRLGEFGNSTPSPYTLGQMHELGPYDEIWHPEDAGWDGEPIGAFWRRVAACADDVAVRPGVTLIVSHHGTTSALLRWALGISPEAPDAFDFAIPNASVTEIRSRADRHGRTRRLLRRIGDAGFQASPSAL